MPLFLCGDTSVYFAHCPKAGGSSIEMFVEGCFGNIELVDRRWHALWAKHGISPQTGRSSPQHATWETIRPAFDSDPDHVFTVVRDPLNRMLSEYRYQLANTSLYPWMSRWMPYASFSIWLNTMLSAARNCPELCDNHFVPQVHFVPKEGARIFKFEQGLHDIVPYLEKIGQKRINEPIPHELKATDSAPPRVTRQNVELVYDTYREDYDRFGYDAPDFSAYPYDPIAPVKTRFADAAAQYIARRYRDGRL